MEEKGELDYLALAESKIVHWFVHNEQFKLEVKCCQIGLKFQMVCFDFYFWTIYRKIFKFWVFSL